MIIFLVMMCSLFFVCRFDKSHDGAGIKFLCKSGGISHAEILCSINAAAIAYLVRGAEKEFAVGGARGAAAGFMGGSILYVALGILAGCLLFACLTDRAVRLVYRFVWYPAAAAGAVLLLLAQNQGKLSWLFCFWALQQFFFSKLYGRGDCHAFCVCALAECAFGMTVLGYLMHMLTAFGLLAAVQAFRGNINGRGNLKAPVAFLPYITVSFWAIMLIYKKLCIFIQK